MHAAALGRKLVYEAFATAKAASDLAGTPVGALCAAFELAFVPEPMAEPAAEARPAIQDAASVPASWTSEPLSLSTERCLCRPNLNLLIDPLG